MKKYGFEQHPIIPTCNNRIGDLLVLREGKPYSFHITKYNPKADIHDKRLKIKALPVRKNGIPVFLSREEVRCNLHSNHALGLAF